MTIKSFLTTARDRMPMKRQLFGALRLTGLTPQWLWSHLIAPGTFTTRIGRFRFRMNHFGAHIENSVYWAGVGGEFEATSILVWAILARDARTTYDIGANSGLFSLVAAAVSRDATVVAFEPLRRIADKVEINARLNDFSIRVETIALSSRVGEIEFFETATDHVYGASIESDELLAGFPVRKTTVTAETLDDYLDRTGDPAPDLIKIDVEKHEPAVLAGFRRRLDPARPPHMIIEVLDDACAEGVTAAIAHADYRAFRIEEGVGLTKVDSLRGGVGRNFLLLGGDAPDIFADDTITHAAVSAAVDQL